MKKYKFYYSPLKEGFALAQASTLVALIPADSIKQALTRFNAAGFEGEVFCIQNVDFDSTLFNF